MDKITDYEDRAENLTPEQLKKIYGGSNKGLQSNFAKETRLFAAQVQALEDAAWDVYTKQTIDAAVTFSLDAVLDRIGELVGESRLARSNFDYAVAIRARIQMNASQGEPERLISAIRAVCTTEDITYLEFYPATIYLTFGSSTAPANIAEIMRKIKSGGVKLDLVRSDADEPFICTRLDGGGVPVVVSDEIGLGCSSLAEPTHGGKLSKILT
jgi:hypothetical protein